MRSSQFTPRSFWQEPSSLSTGDAKVLSPFTVRRLSKEKIYAAQVCLNFRILNPRHLSKAARDNWFTRPNGSSTHTERIPTTLQFKWVGEKREPYTRAFVSHLQAWTWHATVQISKALSTTESVRASRNVALEREADHVHRRFQRWESLRARVWEHTRSVADALSDVASEVL